MKFIQYYIMKKIKGEKIREHNVDNVQLII